MEQSLRRLQSKQIRIFLYLLNFRAEGKVRDLMVRLVIPESLQTDFLDLYRTSSEGSHLKIGCTYHCIRRYSHWKSLFRSMQRYVGSCVDCETAEGGPTLQGNIEAIYTFQIL